MKTIKTSELTGAALDWAVAKCEGVDYATHRKYWFASDRFQHYSTDWSQGGPIIEGGGFVLAFVSTAKSWVCHKRISKQYHGPTPLIAAMRCYVASNLGDNVDIPEELVTYEELSA